MEATSICVFIWSKYAELFSIGTFIYHIINTSLVELSSDFCFANDIYIYQFYNCDPKPHLRINVIRQTSQPYAFEWVFCVWILTFILSVPVPTIMIGGSNFSLIDFFDNPTVGFARQCTLFIQKSMYSALKIKLYWNCIEQIYFKLRIKSLPNEPLYSNNKTIFSKIVCSGIVKRMCPLIVIGGTSTLNW